MLNSFFHFLVIMLVTLLPISEAFSDHVPEKISFDYVQADFTFSTVHVDTTADVTEGNGFGFSLSLEINTHLAFTLSVLSTTYDTFQERDVDSSKLTDIGLTAHTLIAPVTEILANLSVVKAEIESYNGVTSTRDSDYGSIFHIGLRHRLTNHIELALGGTNLNVFDHETFSYNLDARYYFRKVFSFGAGYISGDNADSFQLNIRMDI